LNATKKPPIWMQDYESGVGLSKEVDDVEHLTQDTP